MASGTRGTLKEHVEGIHRDCDWIHTHCMNAVMLLHGDYEKHRKAFESIDEIAVQLDAFANKLYGQL